MINKVFAAPLCRGASLIAGITLPMIVFAVAYIFFFTRGMSVYELASSGEAIFDMIRDTMTSIALSFGGMLGVDAIFKRSNE